MTTYGEDAGQGRGYRWQLSGLAPRIKCPFEAVKQASQATFL